MAQELLHFCVVSQEADIKRIRAVQKNKAQTQIAAALEEMLPQLANADAAMNMGLAKSLAKIAQRLQALGALTRGQAGEVFHYFRVKRERLFQAIP